VTGATFTDNSAADYGGAIDNENDATIIGSTFTGNTS
jgi:predicted outer membrane repeat protein